MLCCWLS